MLATAGRAYHFNASSSNQEYLTEEQIFAFLNKFHVMDEFC